MLRPIRLARMIAILLVAASSTLLASGCGQSSSPLAEQMKPKGIEKEFRPAGKPVATQVR